MKRRAIQFFRRGRWLHLASQYITNPQRMRELVDTVSQYTHRRGLKKLRDNATRLWHYLHKQWIMWFNSTQREEPYQDLTSN